MSSEKQSSLELMGIPPQFGGVLLTFTLILAISPYMGGYDLGIFKVPSFPQTATSVLYFLGPIFFFCAVLLFVPFLEKNSNKYAHSAASLPSNSKYRIQSITEIVKVEAANKGINIDGIQIGDRLHIDDLVRICAKALFPDKPANDIKKILEGARATAFSRKYSAPREDEKLANVSQIQIDGIKPWDSYFTDLLKDLGAKDFDQLDVLNVGVGNGFAEEPFLKKLHSFKAVDISEEALQYADKKYSRMTRYVCAAEEMNQIPNNSVDLYMSLRTYQCSLFNRRAAIHEAYRVLRNGGILVLSIPIMYLQENGEVLVGLIPHGSTAPNMEYARYLAERIKDYLTILHFHDVKTDERSPFELFVCAKR